MDLALFQYGKMVQECYSLKQWCGQNIYFWSTDIYSVYGANMWSVMPHILTRGSGLLDPQEYCL